MLAFLRDFTPQGKGLLRCYRSAINLYTSNSEYISENYSNYFTATVHDSQSRGDDIKQTSKRLSKPGLVKSICLLK